MVTSTRTADGREKVYITNKPIENTYTVFAGEGDDGARIFLKLTDTDEEKEVDLVFSEDVWVQEGRLWCSDSVPFGATADVEFIHPVTNEVLARFCKHVPLCPGWIYLEALDSALLPTGVKVRMEVYNSPGTGIYDPPGPFKVAGIITLYRATPM